eukprot:g47212.t1
MEAECEIIDPRNIEEIKRDYKGWRTVKPLFESPSDGWKTVKGNSKRFFILKGKVHRESPVLSSLKEENGLVTSFQSAILRICTSFYARLYDMKPTDSVASLSFLSSIMKVLGDGTLERLDQPLSLDELTKALESSGKNKTPRSNAYWPTSMRKSMRRGIITLICKQIGEKEEIKNWQPISLLNADFKILPKDIANPKFAKKITFDLKSIRKWSACSVLETLQEKDRVDIV